MELTQSQIDQYNDAGYLVLPDVFSADEVEVLRHEAAEITREHRPEIWREKSGAPRTAFGCHKYSEVFRTLSSDERLVAPVEQLIGETLYIHQFKVNPKVAFDGDNFPWHQDFVTWHEDDGMPEARAMNIAIFLDDVFTTNGALMFVPGSHKRGMIPTTPKENNRRWMDLADVEAMITTGSDIEVATGRAGSVLMFHGNSVHGSAGNMTPLPRRIVYVTYCAVSNAIQRPTRPEFIAHQTFEPVHATPPAAFAEYAESLRT
jgi:ectoine hydroxylase